MNDLLQRHDGMDWKDVWKELYANPWFKETLSRSAIRVLHRSGMPRDWRKDVKQEAMLIFATALKRDTTLGFDFRQGEIKPFLATVLFRCCQKGLRQFRNSMHATIDRESQHPTYESSAQIDECMDLAKCLLDLDEPWRTTISRYLNGVSVPEIARDVERSERTIYRRLDRATCLLRERMATRRKTFKNP